MSPHHGLFSRTVARLRRRAAIGVQTRRLRMRNDEPLVSFSFDDAPDSAASEGAAILEEAGFRGTFYLAAGTCGAQDEHWRVMPAGQVRALHRRGHEIACHTYSHVRVSELSAAQADDQRLRSDALLRQLCDGVAPVNFAYPFGAVSLARKLQLQKHYASCRGVLRGVNAGVIDLGLLKAVDVYSGSLTRERLEQVLREARESNGWVIFYTHDVVSQPSPFGCTPELLRFVVDQVRGQGLRCATVRDALSLAGYPPPPDTA